MSRRGVGGARVNARTHELCLQDAINITPIRESRHYAGVLLEITKWDLSDIAVVRRCLHETPVSRHNLSTRGRPRHSSH